jgi:diguanylate cyclase (GGDEF)-like protein/PAS domain S-box-containing protein
LRNQGYAVRAQQILSKNELVEALKQPVLYILLAFYDYPQLSAKEAVEQAILLKIDLPVIVMFEKLNDDAIIEALLYGASNICTHQNLSMIALMIKKEMEHLEERKAKKQAILTFNASEKRCSLLLESSRAAIAYIHDGMHVYANKSYLTLFGYAEQDDILCIPALDMIDKEYQEAFKEHLKHLSRKEEKNEDCSFSFYGAKENGETFEAIMVFSQANFDHEHCTQILIRPKTDEQALQEQLKVISSLDSETQLFNKHYFLQKLQEIEKKELNQGEIYYLFYIEYDQHHSIIEQYGIKGNDVILKECANWLQQQVNSTNILSRLTDQAFGMLMSSNSIKNIKTLAQSLCEKIKTHLFDLDGKTHTLTFSIGIASMDKNMNDCMTNAQNMTSRLEDGDGFKVYSSMTYNASKGDDPLLMEQVQDAIEAGRIKLLFQPIVKLHGKERPLYQALLQLRTEENTIIDANKAFPIAKKIGLGVKLDKWIISQALRAILKEHRDTHLQIFVKLSNVSLIDDSMSDFIETMFKKSQLQKDRLIFQYDEEDAVNHLKRVIQLTDTLKAKGCRFCLSKFGSNMEKTALIEQLNVDFVKISENVCHNMHLNPESIARIQSLIDEIHQKEMQSIIPKVEEAAMLAALWPLNVQYIQGYYLQRPNEQLNYDFSASGF